MSAARAWCAALLLVCAGCAEPAQRPAAAGDTGAADDTGGTDRELRASLAGGEAAGGRSYSYRGMHAGMARDSLERRLAPRAQPPVCHPSAEAAEEMVCAYDARTGPDSGEVHVEATYAGRLGAREIVVTRQLPLDVDGVRAARELAAAFERQTSLLDRRDASFGHHEAQVRMGTASAANPNFVDLTLAPRLGREILTVRMSRGFVARKPRPEPLAPPRQKPLQKGVQLVQPKPRHEPQQKSRREPQQKPLQKAPEQSVQGRSAPRAGR